MTRKDFTAIADVVIKLRRQLPKSEGALVTVEMADMLAAKYPNFDSQKWYSYVHASDTIR